MQAERYRTETPSDDQSIAAERRSTACEGPGGGDIYSGGGW